MRGSHVIIVSFHGSSTWRPVAELRLKSLMLYKSFIHGHIKGFTWRLLKWPRFWRNVTSTTGRQTQLDTLVLRLSCLDTCGPKCLQQIWDGSTSIGSLVMSLFVPTAFLLKVYWLPLLIGRTRFLRTAFLSAHFRRYSGCMDVEKDICPRVPLIWIVGYWTI